MADQGDPLKPILEQIGEILNFFHKARKEKGTSEEKEMPETSKDFSEQLKELEVGVEFLRKTYELALQKTGVSEKEVLEQVKKHPDHLTDKEKKLLRQITVMRNEAIAIRNAAQRFLKEADTQRKKKGVSPKRKQLGKDVGSRKGWKKM